MAATKPPRRARKPASALQRAVRLLARRDMSRAELQARLSGGRSVAGEAASQPDAGPRVDGIEAPRKPADAPHDPPTGDAIAAALDQLSALGLQSDSRFAEGYVRSRQARTGSRRLAAELRQRGVDGETIGAALADLGESDLRRAHALWARRFSASSDPRERARQARFLAARGFDGTVIRAVLGGLPEDLPADSGEVPPAAD